MVNILRISLLKTLERRSIYLTPSPVALLSKCLYLPLSITPYITSSIIVQLLTIAIPQLEEMQRDGETGRKKIVAITRYLTVGLAFN